MSTAIVPELSRQAKYRAARAIENVHLAYYQRGGLRDTEEKASEQRQSIAQELFNLARFATEQSKTRDAAIRYFGELCEYAETRYKKEHEVENLREALPTWATLKSNILRGVRDYQLDPLEYRSEGAFRIAMQKEQAALPAPTLRVLSPAKLDELFSSTIPHEAVRPLLSQVVHHCELLKKRSDTAAVKVLQSALDELAPLVDQRRAGP